MLTLPPGGHTSMMMTDPRLFPNLTTFAGTGTISAARQFGFVALRLEGGALGTVAVDEGSVLPPAQIDVAPSQETEPNDSRSQAQPLTLPALVNGAISANTGQDFFSFTGKQGDVITAMAETEGMNSDLDTILTLQDSSGATVSSNDQNFLFYQNDSFLELVLPADGTYYLRVTSWTEEGGASFVYRLHVCNHSAAPPTQEPVVESISPSQGSPGSSFALTINGSNLAGASGVSFSPSSGITVSNIQSSATQVTASISIASGATTGTRQVSVTTPAGTSNSVAFTIAVGGQAPAISSISPTQGSQGSSFTLTMTGSDLAGASEVSFSPSSGITVSNIQSSASQVTASVSISSSATTGSRQVSVTTPGGTSNALAFTVTQSQSQTPPPTISWISPTEGSRGTSFTLTINGSDLTGASAVSFSPSSGITVSNVQTTSSTRVTASVTISSSAATGTRQVSVTTPGGTSNTVAFTVSASSGQAPTISSISPTLGTPGSSFNMTIYGTNLTGATAVNFTPSTGITVSNVQSTSATKVTASVSISSGATTGAPHGIGDDFGRYVEHQDVHRNRGRVLRRHLDGNHGSG
ncbi:MAG: hypothetical protein EHM61_29230 [Acidobacteria bacterium]|nr:MAG: hypothetical protein EHM61_29230 [Acidobacteriota bacterium]